MPAKRLTEEQLQEAVDLVAKYGSVRLAAEYIDLPIPTLQSRISQAQNKKVKPTIPPRDKTKSARAIISSDKARFSTNIDDGIVLVGSDAHYWPGHITTAHRAFVKFCKELKPKLVVMNGDIFDGATVSRHARIGWESRPTVKQELDTVKERLGEIDAACGTALKAWPLGNHDARFETRIANENPQYEGVSGFHLKDHFPDWPPCWGVWINDNVVIKHRWKGGIHATYQNTLQSGVTLITGHLHSLKVFPWSDYLGTRYGVDTGTLAEPYGPQFRDYTEDAPRSHRSGFVILSFHKGKLLWPEIVSVLDDSHVDFRGSVVPV